MKKRSLLIALLLSSPLVLAEDLDVSLVLCGFSNHILAPSYAKHNETHNTIGISINNYELMYMKNSFNNDSIVVSRNLKFNSSIDFGLRVGAASNYDINGVYNIGGIAPFIQPNITVSYDRLSAEIGYVPQISHSTPYGVATMLFSIDI